MKPRASSGARTPRKTRFTKTVVKALRYDGDGKNRVTWWDAETPGFGVRITPKGSKSYVVLYRNPAGTLRWYTIGATDRIPLPLARQKAWEVLAHAGLGDDPAQEKTRKRRELRVRDLVDLFLSDYVDAHLRPSTASEYRRQLLTRVVPALGSKLVSEVTRADVAALHQKLGKTAPIQANRTLAAVGKMFSWALEHGHLPEGSPHPARGIKKFRETKRDRWIKPEEFPRLAEAIAEEPNVFVRGALWLILFTGLRRGEVMGLRWTDVDLDRHELHLPDTKAHRAHVVPLSAPAVALLQGLPRVAGNPYVFPGIREGDHLRDLNGPWARIRKRAGLEDVRLHDLRRTVGSWLAIHGASLPLIGKILNHSTPTTTAVYARLAEDPVRAALEEHGRRLLEVAKGLRVLEGGKGG